MTTTISQQVKYTFSEAAISGIHLEDFNILDDEDLIIFALIYLRANISEAFDFEELEDE